MHMDSLGQVFTQGLTELADFCSIMSGASPEKDEKDERWNHLKFYLFTCVVVYAGY